MSFSKKGKNLKWYVWSRMWIAAYKLVGFLTKRGWVPLIVSCRPQHSTQTLCRHSRACLGYLMLYRFGFVAFPKVPHPAHWWGASNSSPVPMRTAGRKSIHTGFSSRTEIKVWLFNVKFRWPLLGCLNTEARSAYTSHCNQWELQISTHGLQITYSSHYH